MEIVNVRIDDRLLHGQVIAVWLNQLGANRIVIIDDFASKDSFSKTVLKMGRPPTVKLSILSVESASRNFNDKKYEGDKIFVIVRDPKTLIDCSNNNLKFGEVNIGFMGDADDKVRISKQIYCSYQQLNHFKTLMDMGVKLTSYSTPGADGIDVKLALDKALTEFSKKQVFS